MVTNAGPSAATNVVVADPFPATLTGVTWTSVGSAGVVGNDASGSGNINDTVTFIPVGGTVTYTVNATIAPTATGTLTNTATVTGADDTNTANNSATDTDTPDPPCRNHCLGKAIHNRTVPTLGRSHVCDQSRSNGRLGNLYRFRQCE